jgi:hypothetical protein
MNVFEESCAFEESLGIYLAWKCFDFFDCGVLWINDWPLHNGHIRLWEEGKQLEVDFLWFTFEKQRTKSSLEKLHPRYFCAKTFWRQVKNRYVTRRKCSFSGRSRRMGGRENEGDYWTWNMLTVSRSNHFLCSMNWGRTVALGKQGSWSLRRAWGKFKHGLRRLEGAEKKESETRSFSWISRCSLPSNTENLCLKLKGCHDWTTKNAAVVQLNRFFGWLLAGTSWKSPIFTLKTHQKLMNKPSDLSILNSFIDLLISNSISV